MPSNHSLSTSSDSSAAGPSGGALPVQNKPAAEMSHPNGAGVGDEGEDENALRPGTDVGLSRMRSHASSIGALDPQGTAELTRRLTESSALSERRRKLDAQADIEKANPDARAGLPPTFDPFDENGKFSLELYLRELLKRSDAQGQDQRTMGVAFKDLVVTGYGTGAGLNTTVGSILTAPLHIVSAVRNALHPPVKTILHTGFTGTVKPGEMLLVLGRPGSGCSTFLKTLASYRDGFRSVEGTMSYAGFTHKDVDGLLRGDVAYAPEDDVHFPTLNVRQTFNFATSTRVPGPERRVTFASKNTRREYREQVREALATILGLRHTYKTLVGNELIRGISGGEKERVSIGEVLATRAKVLLFDNSSRGLDSSTALEFGQALREFTDLLQLTTIASLYQAGEALVERFDKVVLLYQGRQIYFGPLQQACDYFHRLGYQRRFGQTTADYLVSVTDVHARYFRPGWEERAPKSADEFEAAWRASPEGKASVAETQAYLAQMHAERTPENVQAYRAVVKKELASHGVASQVALAMKRRWQVWIGDLPTQMIMAFATLFQALIIGSAYYNMPRSTAGYFSRGGVLFFSLLFNAFVTLIEVQLGYAQRPIVIRQKRFEMLSPWTDALANCVLAVPMSFFNILPFCIVVYFLTGLHYSADAFFIFLAVIWLATLINTAFFRTLSAMFRAQSVAIMCAGIGVINFSLYAGYVIPRPSMVVWWRWLSYCNPLAYAFEIVMGNEFRYLTNVPCAVVVPSGPSYTNVPDANKVCSVSGGRPGEITSDGLAYLAGSYQYYFSNSRRNVGIMFAFLFFLCGTYCFFSQTLKDPTAAGDRIIFDRASPSAKEVARLERRARSLAAKGEATSADVESDGTIKDGAHLQAEAEAEDQRAERAMQMLSTSDKVFTWRNVTFDVNIKGEWRRLLHDVNGFVAPGKLTALMGESGAGKTTLLNTLAMRTGRGVGVVAGEMSISGRPLPKNFKTDTAYCLQQDVHMETTSVREALHFSALLRQPARYTKEEKLDYCEAIIDLLEMRSFADAIVGQPGAGLNVEQRKRLTIAVELAARPSLLIFLDEPTSGLDAQAAWGIVRLLRKLADAGQAILCTIHAPSGELFNVFDSLCLLRKGGHVAYFGDLGHNCANVIEYFGSRSGLKPSENQNIAEWCLDVIGAGATAETNVDWNRLWLESDEYKHMLEQIDRYEIEGRERFESGESEEVKVTRYPAPITMQFWEVLKRVFRHYWRATDYTMAKWALCVIAGLFLGSSFYGQGNKTTVAALQNKLFSIFLAIVLSVSLAQQQQPVFISMRNLWEARENVCYNWLALVCALLIVEVPFNMVAGTLFWVPWFQFIQYPQGSSAVLSWGLYQIFHLYWMTFSSAVSALAANEQLAQVLFSVSFSFVILFCGVVQPPPLLPTFWRAWMTFLSPFTYLLDALLGNALLNQPVRCAPSEFNLVIPPQDQNCAQYLANFSSSLDQPPFGVGYFEQNANGTCSFCQYRMAETFLTNLSTGKLQYSSAHRYRNIGILLAYCLFNALLCIFLFWAVRVHVWTKPKTAADVKLSIEKREQHQLQRQQDRQAEKGATSASGAPSQPSQEP